MGLLDALNLKTPDRTPGSSQGEVIAARIAELRPLISAIGGGAQAALEARLGKLSLAQQAAVDMRDPSKRMALEQAMKDAAERLRADVQRIAGGEPGDEPAIETPMGAAPDEKAAPSDAKPPVNPVPDGGGGKLSPAEKAGPDPDSMSDADRKSALRRWKKIGAVEGDVEALSKALGDKKDTQARDKAREEVKRLHGEIANGQTPAIRDVRPQTGPAQKDDHPKTPKTRNDDDSAPKGDVPMSEANKKKLEQQVRASKSGLDPQQTRDFGRWLINTHGEAEFHKHLMTPESTRAKVYEWMQEQGWKTHKDPKKREKFEALHKKIHGTDDFRKSRKPQVTGGGKHDRSSDGDTRGGSGPDAPNKKPDKGGTTDAPDAGKSPGGGQRPKGGTADSTQGAKGGATGKKGGGEAEGGPKDGGPANKPKGGSKAEPGAKGGAKGGSKADPAKAAKFSDAALRGASRKFSGLMRDSRAKLDALAKSDPAAKEIVDALDKVGLLQDAESFAKNPKGFAASQAKSALIEAPFNHYDGVLSKMMADFEAKYPDVASLNAAPLVNGKNLVQFRQEYEKAMAQLRVPKSRAALIKVFFVLGVNDKTPPDQVRARLKAADEAIAKQPGLKPYVDAYYAAYDAYGFALGMANNRVTDLEESYTKEVSQLAATLRVRGAALGRVSTNLKGVADWLLSSPFIFFAPGEEAWFTFEALASRFGAFGNRLDGFANAVDARKTAYPAEMKRLEAAGKAMNRSLMTLL